jgi:AdoMet-dependent heme synthase
VREPFPHVVAWETTRACRLACVHCRAAAQPAPQAGELTTAEGQALLDDIASFARPLVILSGGEPLLRPDIFDLASYGTSLGLRLALATDDGRLMTRDVASRLRRSGILRVSFSLHYPCADKNDRFTRTEGAFQAALEALDRLRQEEIPFQINTTISRLNLADLAALLDLVIASGAHAWHVFFLVPTGRGSEIPEALLSPVEYERSLLWLQRAQHEAPVTIRPTCAPQFGRIELQAKKADEHPAKATWPIDADGRSVNVRRPAGCLAGDGFCFISHCGEVNPCGYLPLSAGNVRTRPFSAIYRDSPLFGHLRDRSQLAGKCGLCEYRSVCGGCRARAFAISGDYLGEEPYCLHQPGSDAPQSLG